MIREQDHAAKHRLDVHSQYEQLKKMRMQLEDTTRQLNNTTLQLENTTTRIELKAKNIATSAAKLEKIANSFRRYRRNLMLQKYAIKELYRGQMAVDECKDKKVKLKIHLRKEKTGNADEETRIKVSHLIEKNPN